MLSYSCVNTIILGVALKPRDPDKDLKSILISELLMDKPLFSLGTVINTLPLSSPF